MIEITLCGEERNSLPEDGWFNTCFDCATITASTKKYISKCSKDYCFLVYICSNCKNKLTENVFAKKCEISIENLNLPLTQTPLLPSTFYLTHPLKKFP